MKKKTHIEIVSLFYEGAKYIATNDYYRYFLKKDGKFVICLKRNRNDICKNKTKNVMFAVNQYKGNNRMDFMDRRGKKIVCKISYILVKLCESPNNALVLVVVYGLVKILSLFFMHCDTLQSVYFL